MNPCSCQSERRRLLAPAKCSARSSPPCFADLLLDARPPRTLEKAPGHLNSQVAASWRSRDGPAGTTMPDRKSTRLNSSHTVISYAVFCLKKKKEKKEAQDPSR